MKKRKFKLLTKVVFFYLVFTLISFLISAYILQKEANNHMHNILENRFRHREKRIEYILEKKPQKELSSSWADVKQVEKIPIDFKPFYTDTVMLNENTRRENIYRKKTTYLTVNDSHYKLIMTKEADELYKFKDDVYHIVLPVFIILVFAIFLSNYLLSGYLFDPFRRILKKMSAYKIGEPDSLEKIKTSTFEFDQLKKLYQSMRQRIENDYFQLKEYTENMSHELQTPLSIIQNKTESLLSENDLKPGQANKLKAIYNETKQISKLGRALNLITQIENQEFSNIQEIKTAPVIRKHVENIREMADIKQLKIETDLNNQHTLTIDPGLLDILIRNLLKNAIGNSHLSNTVRIESNDKELRITNTGNKPEMDADEIFKRFKKGKGAKTLGLGLAIVKKICEVSGLDVDYNYQDGKHVFSVKPQR